MIGKRTVAVLPRGEATVPSGLSTPVLSRQDAYIMVDGEKGATDEKKDALRGAPVSSGSQAGVAGGLKASVVSALGMKMPEVRTKLVIASSNASAANTALTTVIGLEPATSSEFTSFSALWQECKVHGGDFHYFITSSASAPPSFTVVAFDPLSATALGSVAAGVEAAQHDLRVCFNDAVTTVSPAPVNGRGHYSFRCENLKGVGRSSGSTTTYQGEWSATADGADTYGFLKVYVPALGGAVTSTLNWILVLDISFRSRA